MGRKKKNQGYVMSMLHKFGKKSKEDECNDDLLSLTKSENNDEKSICTSEILIASNLSQTQDENSQSRDECLDTTVSGIKVDFTPGNDMTASEDHNEASDGTCTMALQEIQPSPYDYGARPKTTVISKQTYDPKTFKGKSQEKRVSLILEEKNGGHNDASSFRDVRENTTSDYDRSSDYGTMEKIDISSDDDDNDIVYGRKAFTRSEPNLSELEKDENISDLRPHRNYFIKIKNSKCFQITQEHGSSSFSLNKQPDESEQANRVQTYKNRQECVLQSVRQTNPKVETELFKGGHAYLLREGYYPLVILIGSCYGCGFTAKMLFERALNRSKNEIGAYCLKFAEEASVISYNEKAVLLVLDANGATGSDMTRLNSWYEFLKERLPIGANSKTNLTVIMTLQDFADEQTRVHPIQRKYIEYIVDASEKKYRPSKETKEKLFEALLKQKNVRINPIKGSSPIVSQDAEKITFLDKETADGIVPLLGSVRFIGKLADYFQSNMKSGLNSLRTPIPEVVERIRESHREGGTLFLTLQAVHAHGGQLGVGRINQMRKINEQAEKFWYSADNINKKSNLKAKKFQRIDNIHLQNLYKYAEENGHLMNLGDNLQRYACHLDGEFLAEKNDVYRFCDGRVYYSFLLVYCEQYPNALDDCEDNFFFNFVRSSSVPFEKEYDVFLLVNDRNLTSQTTRAVMKRFKKEMMLRHVAKCMGHPMMTTSFFQLFLKYLQETKHLLWRVLTQQDCDPKEPYSSLYHGLDDQNDTLEDEPRNNTEVIILHDIWKKKRRKNKWKAWTKAQESETLVRSAEISNLKTFKLLVAKGADIPIGALKQAIEVRNEEMIDFILQNGHFSLDEWHEEAKHAAVLISQEKLSSTLEVCLKPLFAKADSNTETRNRPPLLHFAVQTKNAKLMKRLFEGDFTNSQKDVNSKYHDETPLTAAIRSGSREIVETLLDKNAVFSHSDVIIASSQGNADVLNLLVQREPQHMLKEDSDGLIPLFYAVSCGHNDAVDVFLSNAIDQSKTTNDVEQAQVWHLRSGRNDEHILQRLRQKRNHDGQTALHVAAEKGYKAIVLLLLSHGFDLEIRDYRDETPLSLACNGKHMLTVRALLSNCNKCDARVLMRAVKNGDIELLQILIEYNYNINLVNREYGAPLLVAIQQGMHEVVSFLLSKGADTEIEHNGHRPIHLAAANGDVKALKLLMDFGVKIGATTEKKNETVVHIATEKKHICFVKTVLQMSQGSCLIDKKNSDGETAVHIASKGGSSDIISLLLRNGFSSKLTNRHGQIPVTLVTKALQEAIADRDKSKWNAYADCQEILQQSKS